MIRLHFAFDSAFLNEGYLTDLRTRLIAYLSDLSLLQANIIHTRLHPYPIHTRIHRFGIEKISNINILSNNTEISNSFKNKQLPVHFFYQ